VIVRTCRYRRRNGHSPHRHRGHDPDSRYLASSFPASNRGREVTKPPSAKRLLQRHISVTGPSSVRQVSKKGAPACSVLPWEHRKSKQGNESMNAAGNNTNNDERPGKSVGDPEWRKALHPVVTGSHFHQTRVATDKEEYPRLHEFG
jgi:hypothetical protein